MGHTRLQMEQCYEGVIHKRCFPKGERVGYKKWNFGEIFILVKQNKNFEKLGDLVFFFFILSGKFEIDDLSISIKSESKIPHFNLKFFFDLLENRTFGDRRFLWPDNGYSKILRNRLHLVLPVTRQQ